MQTYIIRRIILIIPTLLLASIIVFMIVRFIPGDVVDLMAAQAGGTSAPVDVDVDSLRRALGLDVPVHIQYLNWVAGLFRGDLGDSLWTGQAIAPDLIGRLPVSLELGILALILGLSVALPIGVYSAIRQDTWGDYTGRTISIIFISVPSFWTGTMIMIYPSIWWRWSPPVEYIPLISNVGANLLQFILPAFILGMLLSGGTMRMTRTMMLEVLRQDYIRTAWAKGLNERTVIIRHTLKNALIPVVTLVGLQLPILIGGSVILEQIFTLPGVGRYLLDAINTRDYPIISAVNIVLATFVLAINLMIDLTYGYLDPRIHYQ